jgi:hypothetical protein
MQAYDVPHVLADCLLCSHLGIHNLLITSDMPKILLKKNQRIDMSGTPLSLRGVPGTVKFLNFKCILWKVWMWNYGA